MTRPLTATLSLLTGAALLAALSAPAGAAPSTGPATAPDPQTAPIVAPVTRPERTILTGTSASGATWEARVPSHWNGTVILYAHGFRGPGANPAWDHNNAAVLDGFLDRGYAVVASSYSVTMWALGTAVDDQLDALAQFSDQYAQPKRTIAFGRSMGGLVTGLIAERRGADVDGAVATCGLMHGGIAVNNYQLDAAHAAAVLLVGNPDLKISNYRTREEAAATAATINAAIEQARTTPAGRARLALVGLYLHVPTAIDGVNPKDPEALAEAQAPLIASTLSEVISRRTGITDAAGGDSGWTATVNYRRLFHASNRQWQVRHLYRKAGADLKADLNRLTATADITPDAPALRWMQTTSQPTGRLQVPVLSTHTTYDLLAPVEVQEEHKETVHQAGRGRLLRQAYVDSTGHCAYSVAESVASVEVMMERLDTGHWGNTSARGLNARAEALGLDEARFVTYRPGEFVGDRTWSARRCGSGSMVPATATTC